MFFGGIIEMCEVLEVIFYAFEFLATIGRHRRKCAVSRLPPEGVEKNFL
jgi:hypothetical protein